MLARNKAGKESEAKRREESEESSLNDGLAPEAFAPIPSKPAPAQKPKVSQKDRKEEPPVQNVVQIPREIANVVQPRLAQIDQKLEQKKQDL